MQLVLRDGGTSFEAAIDQLVKGAGGLSMAVSYVQTSGWSFLRERTKHIEPKKITLVFTDQFDTTQPAAIKEALRERANARLYEGNGIYHPKIYLSFGVNGEPLRYLIGSANLSLSAFSTSVEGGILGEDEATLIQLEQWLKSLIEKHSSVPTEGYINRLARRWRGASYQKAKQLVRRPKVPSSGGTASPISLENPVAREALEQVFSLVPDDVITLGFDLAGNNIRSISATMAALQDWENIVLNRRPVDAKKRSELHTLGLAKGNSLTELGESLRNEKDKDRFASTWCRWLASTKSEINPRLRHARRVFDNYRALRPEVQEHYQQNRHAAKVDGSDERLLLQTIEVLCNVCDFVEELSLDDVRGLTWIVAERGKLPVAERSAVEKYITNKGTRTWGEPDRGLIPLAWIKASA